PVPGPLKPLIAVPTTAGTGSETTAVAVNHVLDHHVKAGVSHRLLRPTLGIVDPLNTLTAPAEGAAAAGPGNLTHALQSVRTRPPASGASACRGRTGPTARSSRTGSRSS